MSLWNGNLRNTVSDIVLDTVILAAIVGAYLPQLYRLRTRATTQGIAGQYLLCNAFFAGSQLSEALLNAAYAWPTDGEPVLRQISEGRLRGLAAYGGILGLLQSLVLWACSIITVVLYSAVPAVASTDGRNIAVQAFLHFAVIVIPAVLIALPSPSAHEMGIDIMMAVLSMTSMVVAIVFVILQFYAQFKEMRAQDGHPGSLSLLSVCLQVLVIGGVSLRWLSRLGQPTWNNPASLWLWYTWSMPALNYALHAVGCAVLVASYWASPRGKGASSDTREFESLLA